MTEVAQLGHNDKQGNEMMIWRQQYARALLIDG